MYLILRSYAEQNE